MNDTPRADDKHVEAADASHDSAAKNAPRWHSEEILRGHREILIEHGDELYRLRCTRNGKLILHK